MQSGKNLRSSLIIILINNYTPVCPKHNGWSPRLKNKYYQYLIVVSDVFIETLIETEVRLITWYTPMVECFCFLLLISFSGAQFDVIWYPITVLLFTYFTRPVYVTNLMKHVQVLSLMLRSPVHSQDENQTCRPVSSTRPNYFTWPHL